MESSAEAEYYMIIDQKILDSLTAAAKDSPQLRMNYDLRNTPKDGSQRMLNAIEPGTVMPIHRHRSSSETVVCVGISRSICMMTRALWWRRWIWCLEAMC